MPKSTEDYMKMLLAQNQQGQLQNNQSLNYGRTDSPLPAQTNTIPAAAGPTGAGAAGSTPSWQDRMNELYDRIANRPNFQYDPNTDPAYQALKQQYVLNGRRAMQDTMGQAAGLTGGYGSSYSQSTGQQQYNNYLTQLSGQIPGLMQQARAAYDAEGDRLQKLYSMAYQQGRDELSDQRYNQEWEYQQQRDALSDEWRQREFDADQAYQQWQMGRADRSDARDLAMTMIQAGKTPPADMLEAAGISLSYAQTMASYYAAQMAGYGGSRSSRSSSKTPKSSETPADTMETQVIKPSQYDGLVQKALTMNKDDFLDYYNSNFGKMKNYKEVLEYIKKQIANYGNGPRGGGGGKNLDATR